MTSHFHLFVYGSLRSTGTAVSLLGDGELIGPATVGGILYDMDGAYPALVLYGSVEVRGEVWKLPSSLLPGLDAYERVDEGLFRRVGVTATLEGGEEVGCWIYVAGPALGRKLTAERRVSAWG